MRKWLISVPVYVTRTYGGEHAAYSTTLARFLLLGLLGTINGIFWGVIGIIEGVKYFT